MDDHNNKPDDLDRILDAALSRYASVEPRPGLEQRILANLNQANSQAERTTWWRWPLAAVAAVIVIVAVWAWRSPHTSTVPIAGRPDSPSTVEAPPKHSPAVGHVQPRPEPPTRSPRHSVRSTPTVVATAPKLDSFPSPQPLNEQEKILARYVESYPDKAVLIARAQADLERLDREEELRIQGLIATDGPARTED